MKDTSVLANTRCLIKACKELLIPYTFYDDNENVIRISLDRDYFFVNSTTPFNDEALAKIYKDKEFTYRVVKDLIKTPRTVGFLDPECSPEHKSYVSFSSQDQIVAQMESQFAYPFVVKMNSGARGNNVFMCADQVKAREALHSIYNKSSRYYDYIAIAQERIAIVREFRIIVFQGEIVLTYEKDFSAATVKGNLSPLHQENSKAALIDDSALIQLFAQFIAPLCEKISIGFAGLDIAIDDKGDLWLIEINSKPGFGYFVRDNGDEPLVGMYKAIFNSLI